MFYIVIYLSEIYVKSIGLNIDVHFSLRISSEI